MRTRERDCQRGGVEGGRGGGEREMMHCFEKKL